LDLVNHLLDGFTAMVRIVVDNSRLAKHVQFFRLNDEGFLTASAALVAFVTHKGKDRT
jgi:hypothetical protein